MVRIELEESDVFRFLPEMIDHMIDAVIAVYPNKLIALDTLFDGNDQLKTNTALQMRDTDVEFRTV